MESKKNMSGFFRESLEQLDYAPSGKVWEQIELDLDKKKKKRRFVLWFFFASLLTVSLLGGFFYDYPGKNAIKNEKTVTAPNRRASQNPAVATIENNQPDSTVPEESGREKILNGNQATADKTTVNEIQKKRGKRENMQPTSADMAGLAKAGYSGKKKQNQGLNLRKSTNGNIQARQGKSGDSDLSLTKNPAKSIPEGKKTNENETILTEPATNNTTEIVKSTIVDSLIAAKTDNPRTKKNRREKDSLATKDSTAVAEKEKEHEIIVAPYAGINYGGYFGEFNSLSENQILENKGQMRAIYGVLVRWMFNDRLGLQTGAGKINSRQFTTIDKTDYPFINTQNVATDIPYGDLMGIFANETKVKFTYDSSVIEVPLEAYYVLRDKKLGFAASFGVSVLFGGKNTVYAESENVQKMKIGTLTTDTKGGFTANGKLYMFYKITPSLQLDLYPSFQYRIMGDTQQGYSGYFFSLRTGLSYKF